MSSYTIEEIELAGKIADVNNDKVKELIQALNDARKFIEFKHSLTDVTNEVGENRSKAYNYLKI